MLSLSASSAALYNKRAHVFLACVFLLKITLIDLGFLCFTSKFFLLRETLVFSVRENNKLCSLFDHKIRSNDWDDDVQNEDDDVLFFHALEALAVLSKQRVVLRFFLSSFSVLV